MSTQHPKPAGAVMCPCSGTTLGKIQSLFEQGLEMEDISRITGAISGCGGCEWDIAQLLNDLAEPCQRPAK